MPDTTTRQGVTIEILHGRMIAALGDLRSGTGDKATAVARLDSAISQACRIPAMNWRDASAKAAMLRITLTGANASASRRVIESIERDLENLPPRRSAEH
ncbi:MAG: hypothetical protein LC676_08155 [Loktanella sp.]|nr:hypothetical protein [Loktanella sp.]